MKKKKILFFADLEGTILRDSDGDFDEADFEDLIKELSKLGELTDSIVQIRLVSPIGFRRMDKVVDKIDALIVKYFRKVQSGFNVELTEAATSPFDIMTDDSYSVKRVSKKITVLPDAKYSSDIARVAKEKYLTYIYEAYKDNEKISIYAGNDRNDLSAMKYLKTRQRGILICPATSIEEVKKMSDIISDKDDLKGIVDCVSIINKQIEKRTISKNEKTNKDEDERL